MANGWRALVVEDDDAWQEILGEVLDEAGFTVDSACCYDDALARLRATAYRLAVVDLSLKSYDAQNRDGLRVLQAVREHAPGCLAILLSGFATVELAVSALNDYHAYTVLRKETFRRAELRTLAGRILAAAPPSDFASATGPRALRSRSRKVRVWPGARSRGNRRTRGLALVVENDAGWRSILGELLVETGYRVRSCRSYGEALGYLLREHIALAVVDIALAAPVGPEGDRGGYEVLAATRAAGIPSLVVSGLAQPEDVRRTYAEYGVFAYLEKQAFDRRVFRQTVTAVPRALTAEAAGALARRAGSHHSSGLAVVDPRTQTMLARLTPREREVLQLLLRGETNKGIARGLMISTNTVKRYLKVIFEKLEVNSRAAAAAKAVSAGLK